MKQLFNIPGAVWVTGIVMLTNWLNDSFPDQPWLPAVVIFLGAVAKLIQMYWPAKSEAPPAQPAASGAPDGDDYTYTAPPKPAPRPSFAAFFLG